MFLVCEDIRKQPNPIKVLLDSTSAHDLAITNWSLEQIQIVKQMK